MRMSTRSTRVISTPPTSDRPRPTLLTPNEVAETLRTSKSAIYAMIERFQLPGIVRIGRRVLIREDALVDWLRQKSESTPSPEG
jgi:excisionase family DNA binding protein